MPDRTVFPLHDVEEAVEKNLSVFEKIKTGLQEAIDYERNRPNTKPETT